MIIFPVVPRKQYRGLWHTAAEAAETQMALAVGQRPAL